MVVVDLDVMTAVIAEEVGGCDASAAVVVVVEEEAAVAVAVQ